MHKARQPGEQGRKSPRESGALWTRLLAGHSLHPGPACPLALLVFLAEVALLAQQPCLSPALGQVERQQKSHVRAQGTGPRVSVTPWTLVPAPPAPRGTGSRQHAGSWREGPRLAISVTARHPQDPGWTSWLWQRPERWGRGAPSYPPWHQRSPRLQLAPSQGGGVTAAPSPSHSLQLPPALPHFQSTPHLASAPLSWGLPGARTEAIGLTWGVRESRGNLGPSGLLHRALRARGLAPRLPRLLPDGRQGLSTRPA